MPESGSWEAALISVSGASKSHPEITAYIAAVDSRLDISIPIALRGNQHPDQCPSQPRNLTLEITVQSAVESSGLDPTIQTALLISVEIRVEIAPVAPRYHSPNNLCSNQFINHYPHKTRNRSSNQDRNHCPDFLNNQCEGRELNARIMAEMQVGIVGMIGMMGKWSLGIYYLIVRN